MVLSEIRIIYDNRHTCDACVCVQYELFTSFPSEAYFSFSVSTSTQVGCPYCHIIRNKFLCNKKEKKIYSLSSSTVNTEQVLDTLNSC